MPNLKKQLQTKLLKNKIERTQDQYLKSLGPIVGSGVAGSVAAGVPLLAGVRKDILPEYLGKGTNKTHVSNTVFPRLFNTLLTGKENPNLLDFLKSQIIPANPITSLIKAKTIMDNNPGHPIENVFSKEELKSLRHYLTKNKLKEIPTKFYSGQNKLPGMLMNNAFALPKNPIIDPVNVSSFKSLPILLHEYGHQKLHNKIPWMGAARNPLLMALASIAPFASLSDNDTVRNMAVPGTIAPMIPTWADEAYASGSSLKHLVSEAPSGQKLKALLQSLKHLGPAYATYTLPFLGMAGGAYYVAKNTEKEKGKLKNKVMDKLLELSMKR